MKMVLRTVVAVAVSFLAMMLLSMAAQPPAAGGRVFGALPAHLAPERPQTLRGQRVLAGDDTLGVVVDFEITERAVLVLDRRPLRSPNQLLGFSRDTGELVQSAGPQGQGPNDIGYPQSLAMGPLGQLWVYDYSNARLSRYEDGRWADGPVESLRTPTGQFHQPIWTSGDAFASNGVFPGELLRFYLRQGEGLELVGAAGQAPVPGLEPNVAIQVNRNRIAYSRRRELIALAFNLLSRVHIYSLDGRLVRAIAGPEEIELHYRVGPSSTGGGRFAPQAETRIGYVDIAASDEFIFAAFSGKPFADEDSYHIAEELHVFRWDGEFVGVWVLDTGVTRLRFDRFAGTLWGLRENPSTAIVEFERIELGASFP